MHQNYISKKNGIGIETCQANYTANIAGDRHTFSEIQWAN